MIAWSVATYLQPESTLNVHTAQSSPEGARGSACSSFLAGDVGQRHLLVQALRATAARAHGAARLALRLPEARDAALRAPAPRGPAATRAARALRSHAVLLQPRLLLLLLLHLQGVAKR